MAADRLPDPADSTVMDTTRKYARYCAAVTATLLAHPEYRRGQTYFNVLYFNGFDPEFADSIRGSDLDPFNNDSRIETMLVALAERWKGQSAPVSAAVSPAEPPEIAHKEPEPMNSRERTLRFWLARVTAYPRWVSIGSINSHAELPRVSAEDYEKIQEVLRGR